MEKIDKYNELINLHINYIQYNHLLLKQIKQINILT